MKRDEHVQWCKSRAMEYVEAGDFDQALTSMASDLGKHEETSNHAGIELMLMMRMAGQLEREDQVRAFIEGFN
jgi:uncharacterized protein HemY